MMKRKAISRITMATGVVAMSIGLVNAFSLETQAATTTGGKLLPAVVTCTDQSHNVYAYGTSCSSGQSNCTAVACPGVQP